MSTEVVGSAEGNSNIAAAEDPSSISDECFSTAEEAAAQVLNCVHPTLDSEEKRTMVIDYVQNLVKTRLNCEVVCYGSFPLKTYLPDGDIDLTVLHGGQGAESLARDVLHLLQDEEQDEISEYDVTDTQFIDAEVKLVKCLVRGIVIDMSFNQLGGLSTLCFLEQVDRLVGRNHLFKRSVILVKSWCYYESRILGAHHGLISTYALQTLILYIFQNFHSSMKGPLTVLYKFLDYYSQFDWENYCISLKGPVCVSSLPKIEVKPPKNGLSDPLLSEKFLENIVEMYLVSPRGVEDCPKTFQPKHLNVIDPLKEYNNLGRSVNRGNFYRIQSALKYGARKLRQTLLGPKDEVVNGIHKFFGNTRARHENHGRNHLHCLDLEYDDEESLAATLSSPDELYSELDSDVDNNTVGVADWATNDSMHVVMPTSRNGQAGYTLSEKYSASLSKNLCLKPEQSGSLEAYKEKASVSWLENRDEYAEMNSGNTIVCCTNNTVSACEMDSSLATKVNIKKSSSADGASTGDDSETFEALADLTGDYDNHVRSLLRGHLCQGSASSAPSNKTQSGKKTTKQEFIPESDLLLRQNMQQLPQMNLYRASSQNAVHPGVTSAFLGTAFQFEAKQKPRGTGTYFPQMNVYCDDKLSHGWGGRNREGAGNHNQLHNYGENRNGLYPDYFEYRNNEAVSPQNKHQGQRNFVNHRSINRHSSMPCNIEFGSIGNLAEEVLMGSASTPLGLCRTQGPKADIARERVADQTMIHLKSEDEFPPLCQ